MNYGIVNDFIPDLCRVTYSHSPKFAFDRSLPSPLEVIAIAWLADEIGSEGHLKEDTLMAIRWAHDNLYVDQGLMGYHTCNICGQYDDRGEFLIQTREKTYLMPKMILHYIDGHSYLPPQEFIEDVDRWWKETDRIRNS